MCAKACITYTVRHSGIYHYFKSYSYPHGSLLQATPILSSRRLVQHRERLWTTNKLFEIIDFVGLLRHLEVEQTEQRGVMRCKITESHSVHTLSGNSPSLHVRQCCRELQLLTTRRQLHAGCHEALQLCKLLQLELQMPAMIAWAQINPMLCNKWIRHENGPTDSCQAWCCDSCWQHALSLAEAKQLWAKP